MVSVPADIRRAASELLSADSWCLRNQGKKVTTCVLDTATMRQSLQTRGNNCNCYPRSMFLTATWKSNTTRTIWYPFQMPISATFRCWILLDPRWSAATEFLVWHTVLCMPCDSKIVWIDLEASLVEWNRQPAATCSSALGSLRTDKEKHVVHWQRESSRFTAKWVSSKRNEWLPSLNQQQKLQVKLDPVPTLCSKHGHAMTSPGHGKRFLLVSCSRCSNQDVTRGYDEPSATKLELQNSKAVEKWQLHSGTHQNRSFSAYCFLGFWNTRLILIMAAEIAEKQRTKSGRFQKNLWPGTRTWWHVHHRRTRHRLVLCCCAGSKTGCLSNCN